MTMDTQGHREKDIDTDKGTGTGKATGRWMSRRRGAQTETISDSVADVEVSYSGKRKGEIQMKTERWKEIGWETDKKRDGDTVVSEYQPFPSVFFYFLPFLCRKNNILGVQQTTMWRFYMQLESTMS